MEMKVTVGLDSTTSNLIKALIEALAKPRDPLFKSTEKMESTVVAAKAIEQVATAKAIEQVATAKAIEQVAASSEVKSEDTKEVQELHEENKADSSKYSLEEVRAALAKVKAAGNKVFVREILNSYNASNIMDIDEQCYCDIMNKVAALGI